MNTEKAYLINVEASFRSMKKLAEGTFVQLDFEELHFSQNEESNSIALLVKHMSGNMISRFTDFLTTDGEKPNRNRDEEFEGGYPSKEELIKEWNNGWGTLFQTLSELNEDDVFQTIFIRGEPHSVMEALQRQISHYSYHIGQIIYLGKMIRNKKWKTLSVPRGNSKEFTKMMLEKNNQAK